MPAKRAPRIAAPGAERIELTGIIAVSDKFDRMRLIIMDHHQDGRDDNSAIRLRRLCPSGTGTAPFDLREEPTLPPTAEDVRGTCWIVVPARHRAHWLSVATELRGRRVRVEALVRRYAFEQAEGDKRSGVSLDLAMLSEVVPA